MNKWICFAVLILSHTSKAILGLDCTLEITGRDKNAEVPVWIRDHVEMAARNTFIFIWSFNNSIIAEFDAGSSSYRYPLSPLNVTASSGLDDSFLTLGNVNHIYTGTYEADTDSDISSLHMTVHEVSIALVKFNLTNDSGLCRAYLQINDSIAPLNSKVYRTVNSSDLTFTSTRPSNVTSFEVDDSRLTDNSTNTEIIIQYTFTDNNCSTVISNNIFLEKLINKPNIIMHGTPDNCTFLIQHNTNVECVRNITYCLNTNDMELQCNISHNLDNLTLEYPWNFTSIDLFIVYDIIYAKYRFDINVIQCTAEVATSVEPTTMNSSPTEITTSQSGTSDSPMFPSLSSTDLDTATILLTTVSSELPNITLSPTMNPTVSPPGAESLAGWEIALIVVGSVIGVVLLGGGVSFFLWKKKSKKTLSNGSFRTTKIEPREREIPLEIRSSSNEHVVRKSIPRYEPTNRLPAQPNRRRPLPPISKN